MMPVPLITPEEGASERESQCLSGACEIEIATLPWSSLLDLAYAPCVKLGNVNASCTNANQGGMSV